MGCAEFGDDPYGWFSGKQFKGCPHSWFYTLVRADLHIRMHTAMHTYA